MSCLDRDTPQASILEPASPIPRDNFSCLRLLHQDNGVQNPWYCCRCNDCGPDNAVRRGQVIEKLRWRVAIEGDDRNVENPTCKLICLSESQGAPGPEYCLYVLRSAGRHTIDRSLLALRAQSTVSNRAPVCKNLLNQLRKGSSHAVIRLASEGLRSVLSSSSVRVHTKAAMRLPQEVPAMTRGSRFESRRALTTPK